MESHIDINVRELSLYTLPFCQFTCVPTRKYKLKKTSRLQHCGQQVGLLLIIDQQEYIKKKEEVVAANHLPP